MGDDNYHELSPVPLLCCVCDERPDEGRDEWDPMCRECFNETEEFRLAYLNEERAYLRGL